MWFACKKYKTRAQKKDDWVVSLRPSKAAEEHSTDKPKLKCSEGLTLSTGFFGGKYCDGTQ
jgi:hypothetical protein